MSASINEEVNPARCDSSSAIDVSYRLEADTDQAVAEILRTRRSTSSPSTLVAVSGIDGGKSRVSALLQEGLQQECVRVARINIGWLNLPGVRFNPTNPADPRT